MAPAAGAARPLHASPPATALAAGAIALPSGLAVAGATAEARLLRFFRAEYAVYDAIADADPDRVVPLDVLATLAMNSRVDDAPTGSDSARRVRTFHRGLAAACDPLLPAIPAGADLPEFVLVSPRPAAVRSGSVRGSASTRLGLAALLGGLLAFGRLARRLTRGTHLLESGAKGIGRLRHLSQPVDSLVQLALAIQGTSRGSRFHEPRDERGVTFPPHLAPLDPLVGSAGDFLNSRPGRFWLPEWPSARVLPGIWLLAQGSIHRVLNLFDSQLLTRGSILERRSLPFVLDSSQVPDPVPEKRLVARGPQPAQFVKLLRGVGQRKAPAFAQEVGVH